MDEYLSSFLNYSSGKWHIVHATLLVLLLTIIILIFYNTIARKSVREALIYKRILSRLHSHLQSITFRCNVDSTHTVKYISDNIFACIGYDPKSIINNKEISYLDLIHTDDRLNVLTTIRSCTPTKKNYQIEYRINTKWGAEKWILEQGIGIFDKKGNLKSLEGILTDTTNDNFSEEFLRESEKRFQVLIEHAPVGICIFYKDIITFVNPVYLNMFGITSPQDVLGSSVLDCIAPQKRELIEKLIQKNNLGLRSKSGYETIGLRRDGSHFFLQIFLTNVKLGDFQAALAYFIDITEYKQSEEKLISLNQRLSDIIELIPDPTFIIDKYKQIIHWNRATEELTGVKKDEVLGKGDYIYSVPFYGEKCPMLLDLIDSEDKNLEKNYNNIKRIKDKIYAEFSGPIVNKKGQTYLWCVAAPLHDSDGNRFGTIEVIKDITDAKLREIALFESEKKARIVIDTFQDIILLVKTDGTILDCNEGLCRIFGKFRDELIGSNIESSFPEKYRPYRQSMIGKVLKAGKPITFEDKSSDDSEYYTTRIYPVKDDQNEIKSLVIYAQNTTKLKKTEKALKDSEEQYKAITESISDYLYKVIIENDKTRFVFNNPGSEKILGYTSSDFKTNPDLFYDIILPEDKQLVISYLQIITEQKTNRTIEHRVLHKNGKTIWVSNTLIFYKERTESIIEINGVIKDITFRKHFEHALQEAEERYRSVFDQSGLASNVYDLTGKLIMQNTLAARMFGGTPNDFIGKPIEEIHFSETARAARQIISKTLREGTTIDEREAMFPSGKYWLKTTGHAIRDDSGNVIGIQLISQDFTEKKELDRKILNTIIETEEKERIHFAQELHDGLGPLISAIKMYVQWLSRPDVKVSQNEILSDTERLINDAIQTIREISFKLSPHILNNFGLIEAIRTFAEKVQLSKNIEIEITSNFSERIEDTTETILYRILCECINNTLKHANATKIEIKFLKLDKKLKINYLDNGIGFLVEQTLNKKTGNGLFNMQSRLQSINGSLVIKSKPGNGTKIMITIRL